MGLSLVGNSGDSKTTSNVYETDYTASLNPQNDQEGAGPGDLALNVSPNIQGSSDATVNTTAASYFAPVNITSTGDIEGDSAIQGLAGIAASQDSDTQTAAPATSLSSLLSGNTLYWILGAIVFLFLAHKR